MTTGAVHAPRRPRTQSLSRLLRPRLSKPHR